VLHEPTINQSIIENKNKCNSFFIESSPSFAVTFKHFPLRFTFAGSVTILLHLKTLFIIELQEKTLKLGELEGTVMQAVVYFMVFFRHPSERTGGN
jgi:hypothetical protein